MRICWKKGNFLFLSLCIIREVSSRGDAFCCNFCRMKFTRTTSLREHQMKPHTVRCDLCELRFTSEIFLEQHLSTDHDIKSTSPPPHPLKKLKTSVKEESSKKEAKEVVKGEKMKEVLKGETKEASKGEKGKKEPRRTNMKPKSKAGSPENDTVCEVSFRKYTSYRI